MNKILELLTIKSVTKWYPQYCFTGLDDTNITHILSWSSEDLLENSTENPQLMEVNLKLSNGTERWCFFSTPEHLALCGNTFGVEQIRWHEPMAHLLVNHVLQSLEAQGEIISSTLD